MFDFAALYDAAVADAPDGAVFVEVECLAGRSTCYLGTKIKGSGKAITLYAVDTGRGSASDTTGQWIAPSLVGSLAGSCTATRSAAAWMRLSWLLVRLRRLSSRRGRC